MQIERSVEQLGFHVRDIKVLLISHAHSDHAAGSAAILRATGAKYEVMDGDVDVVESGGRTDFAFGHGEMLFPRAKVDRVLHDGDVVRLGGTELVAHKTAGSHARLHDVDDAGDGGWAAARRGDCRELERAFGVSAGGDRGEGGRRRTRGLRRTMSTALRCGGGCRATSSWGRMAGTSTCWASWLACRGRGQRRGWIPAGYKAAVAERQAAFARELQRQETAAGR